MSQFPCSSRAHVAGSRAHFSGFRGARSVISDECPSSCAHFCCRCRFIPDTPLGQPPHIYCTCAASLLSELEFVVPVHRIYLQLTLGQNVLCLCSDSEQPSSAHNRCTGCSESSRPAPAREELSQNPESQNCIHTNNHALS